MEKIKYLYIDDENTDIVTSIAEALSDENIEVTIAHPKDWQTQIAELSKKEYNGLILDLRLDIDREHGVPYRGLSLAQEIRTRATETNSKLDYPLILCSAEERILKSFKSDKTGHNLFDEMFIKTEIEYSQARIILSDLAKAYEIIRDDKSNIPKLLNYQEIDMLDIRLVDFLYDLINKKAPVHEFARFILNQIAKYMTKIDKY